MSVVDALQKRVSTRAYLDKPVPEGLLRKIFQNAQRSPSNCNTQPWQSYIVSGAKKDELKNKMIATVMSGAKPNPDFNWEVYYEGIHKERQYDAAYTLYSAMGIERDDKIGREHSMLRNFRFFDAPHVVFFVMEKYLGIMGAVDIGIYAQSLALLMAEADIASCMQGSLGMYPGPTREVLELPDNLGILFGMSFGYADPDAPANRAITCRADLQSSATFVN